jgi:hypothetical protein
LQEGGGIIRIDVDFFIFIAVQTDLSTENARILAVYKEREEEPAQLIINLECKLIHAVADRVRACRDNPYRAAVKVPAWHIIALLHRHARHDER